MPRSASQHRIEVGQSNEATQVVTRIAYLHIWPCEMVYSVVLNRPAAGMHCVLSKEEPTGPDGIAERNGATNVRQLVRYQHGPDKHRPMVHNP